jgi:hypothetical protein
MKTMQLKTRIIFCLSALIAAASYCPAQETPEQRTNSLEAYYKAHDPHYHRVLERLFAQGQTGIESRLADLKSALPKDPSSDLINRCQESISDKLTTIAQAKNDPVPEAQMGTVAVIISDDQRDRGLARLRSDCQFPETADRVSRLMSFVTELQSEFDLIDETRARQKAKAAVKRMQANDSCENRNLEGDFSVRSVQLESPFSFLPWVKERMESAQKEISVKLKDQRFQYKTAIGFGLDTIETIEKQGFLPDAQDFRFAFRVEMVAVKNCSDQKLDLIYRVYSSQILPSLSGIPESRIVERETPQTAAGQTSVKAPSSSPLHLTPLGSYDSLKKFAPGLRTQLLKKGLLGLPLQSLVVEGEGTNEMQSAAAAISGSTDSQSWIAHLEWSLSYAYLSSPTGVGDIKTSTVSAQFSGLSRPFWGGKIALRFGGLLQGGNSQSNLRTIALPPKTVDSAGIANLKLYAGLDSRFSRNILSATYGLALGGVDTASRVDWRKHIVDVRHEFWYPLGDHHTFELESRFGAGKIQVPGKIPLAERFFGGNTERLFIPGDNWEIRAEPFIRALPASSLFRTPQGPGGTAFVNYNLTAAYAIWRKPLVPSEITNDDDFQNTLQDTIDTFTNNLQNSFVVKDTHYKGTRAKLPELQTALGELLSTVQALQQPGQFETDFKACIRAIKRAAGRADDAAKDQEDVGSLRDLLSPSVDVDENRLVKSAAATKQLLTDLGTPAGLAQKLAIVEEIHSKMETEFGAIDQVRAAAEAKAIMNPSRRMLDTLFKDINILAISPVFVFDIAKLSPRSNTFGGTRYGPGGGLRFEIATIAHFTAGYARNSKRQPGEAKGSFFFSIGLRDLFH